MEIIYKSKEEIEDVAFRTLRDSNNKSLLNNKNIDCFLMGWEHAASDIKEQIKEQKEDDFKDYLEQMKVFCSEHYHNLEKDLGYEGYQFSYPKSADAMLKLYDQMMRCCDFLIVNLGNVKMSYLDYYQKRKQNEK